MQVEFLLAERIVSNCDERLDDINNRKEIGFYSFKSSTITPSSILIEYVKADSLSQLNISLSLHPLDVPWKFHITIGNKVLDSNYEVYPNLLKDPNGLGNELAIQIAEDILEYLRNRQ